MSQKAPFLERTTLIFRKLKANHLFIINISSGYFSTLCGYSKYIHIRELNISAVTRTYVKPKVIYGNVYIIYLLIGEFVLLANKNCVSIYDYVHISVYVIKICIYSDNNEQS